MKVNLLFAGARTATKILKATDGGMWRIPLKALHTRRFVVREERAYGRTSQISIQFFWREITTGDSMCDWATFSHVRNSGILCWLREN
jgi:hypothetical protein